MNRIVRVVVSSFNTIYFHRADGDCHEHYRENRTAESQQRFVHTMNALISAGLFEDADMWPVKMPLAVDRVLQDKED